MIINNNTNLPIEQKVDQLYACIHKMLGEINFEIDVFTCEHLDNGVLNFVTKGIYLVHGSLITNTSAPINNIDALNLYAARTFPCSLTSP